jgi:hypothetical protein
VLVLVLVYSRGSTHGPGAQTASNPLEAQGAKVTDAVADVDTDGDGLPDWEEALWHTNPKLADTDGNGVTDADQVAKQRNMLAQASATSDPSSDPAAADDTANATKFLGKEVFASYLALKKDGAYSSDLNDSIINESLQQALLSTDPPIFTKDDLTLSSNISKVAIETYQAALHKTLNVESSQYDMVLLHQVIASEDPKAREQFDNTMEKYAAMLVTLRTMPVPEVLAEKHLAMLNALEATVYDMAATGNVRDDALKAMTASERLSGDIQLARETIRDLDLEITAMVLG